LNPVAFSTQRLILRSLRESDQDLYCRLFCDPDTMRYIGPQWTRAEATRAFRGALKAMRTTPPRGLFLTVVHQDAQQPIGLCTLQNFDLPRRRAELGLMLVASGRAYGAATEALIAFIEHAFATLPFDELWVRFSADHAAARHTALSGGLVRHTQATPEDLAANLSRWSAYRVSWRFPVREEVSVRCSAAND
jgi:Acetyltransferases, including N-acetylases of ribosomal proteins